ncbi:MAG: hypothetical protein JO316_20715 [Abitibacteriaceae bacterium]|nr:hypothetical protein [Abditibacteriaceae bacterium]MBV9867782.1 hypothetical protein [Abditibacteriaceae bacterium]
MLGGASKCTTPNQTLQRTPTPLSPTPLAPSDITLPSHDAGCGIIAGMGVLIAILFAAAANLVMVAIVVCFRLILSPLNKSRQAQRLARQRDIAQHSVTVEVD